MKPLKHIAIMLLVLFTCTAFMQAQTAKRTDPRNKNERATVNRATHREAPAQKNKTTRVTQQRSPQKAYQTEKKQPERQKVVKATRQRTQQTVNRTGNTKVERQRTVQATRQRTPQTVNRTGNAKVEPRGTSTPIPSRERSGVRQDASRNPVAHRDRPVSISTPHNPNSKYRSPAPRTSTKHNKYSEKRYYSGHYYHHVYPTRRVRVHYHYDTYIHGYHVLYRPPNVHIYWTRDMYRDYRRWYPNYHWHYRYGYRIQAISVFDAKYNLGEVAMVYGRVYATWYNRDTDDYLLFFGGDYPHQQFTVVLPGRVARKFNWRPERFFLGQHVTVTGLITTFDGIPEIIVKNRRQMAIY